jgi:hypothetical protein
MTTQTDTYRDLIDVLLQRTVESDSDINLVLTSIRLEKPELIPDPTLSHITAALLSLLGEPASTFTTELIDDIEFRMDTAD